MNKVESTKVRMTVAGACATVAILWSGGLAQTAEAQEAPGWTPLQTEEVMVQMESSQGDLTDASEADTEPATPAQEVGIPETESITLHGCSDDLEYPTEPQDDQEFPQCGPDKPRTEFGPPPAPKPKITVEEALRAMEAKCTFDTASAYCVIRGYQQILVPLSPEQPKLIISLCICPDKVRPDRERAVRIPLPGAKAERCKAFKAELDQLCADAKKM